MHGPWLAVGSNFRTHSQFLMLALFLAVESCASEAQLPRGGEMQLGAPHPTSGLVGVKVKAGVHDWEPGCCPPAEAGSGSAPLPCLPLLMMQAVP